MQTDSTLLVLATFCNQNQSEASRFHMCFAYKYACMQGCSGVVVSPFHMTPCKQQPRILPPSNISPTLPSLTTEAVGRFILPPWFPAYPGANSGRQNLLTAATTAPVPTQTWLLMQLLCSPNQSGAGMVGQREGPEVEVEHALELPLFPDQLGTLAVVGRRRDMLLSRERKFLLATSPQLLLSQQGLPLPVCGGEGRLQGYGCSHP